LPVDLAVEAAADLVDGVVFPADGLAGQGVKSLPVTATTVRPSRSGRRRVLGASAAGASVGSGAGSSVGTWVGSGAGASVGISVGGTAVGAAVGPQAAATRLNRTNRLRMNFVLFILFLLFVRCVCSD